MLFLFDIANIQSIVCVYFFHALVPYFLLHGEDIFFCYIIYKTVFWQCLLFSRTGQARIVFPLDVANIGSIVCVYFFSRTCTLFLHGYDISF